MKVNSERYRKRDSNSIHYFTELHFDLLCMIKKKVKVLPESLLLEKPISLQFSSNMHTFDITNLYQNNPQFKP